MIFSRVNTETDKPSSVTATDCTATVQVLDVSVKNQTSPEYWSWRQVFEQDSGALICQHPDFVFHEMLHLHSCRLEPAFVVTSSSQSSLGHPRVPNSQETTEWPHPSKSAAHPTNTDIGIGVLIPKTIDMKEISGMGPAWTLRGYRLSGSRFLGNQNLMTQRALLSAALARLSEVRADFLLLEDLIENSPLWKLCHSQENSPFRIFLPKPVQARLRIRFPENSQDYWMQFNSKRRWNFRHKIKTFGDSEFVQITKVDQIPDFLKCAHRISHNSWQKKHLGLRIHNDKRELKLLTFLASQGALRCYLLFKDGTPAAFTMGSQFKEYFDHIEIAYDRQFSRKSPGQVLLLKILEDLIQQATPTWLDFGSGDAEYKQIFANDVSRSGNVWFVPQQARSRLATGYLKTCLALNRSARFVLDHSGQSKKFRQWIRGRPT